MLPVSHIVQVDRDNHTFGVDAEPHLVEATPYLDVGGRTEREEEQRFYEHYGWPPYSPQAEHDMTPIGSLSGELEQVKGTDHAEGGFSELQLASQFVGAYKVHASEEELRGDPAFSGDVLEPIEILGLDQFGDSAIIIKACMKTKPIKQWAVGREFNRRLKKLFDEKGIEIPYPHLTLYMGQDKAGQSPLVNVALQKNRCGIPLGSRMRDLCWPWGSFPALMSRSRKAGEMRT